MNEPTHPAAWRARLEDELTGPGARRINRIIVVAQTDSTMDLCRAESNGEPGLAAVTLKQTGGRGRLGRRWIDERGEGLAMTLGVARQPSERLAVASGLTVARAIESLGVTNVRLRWPNDVLVDDRKLSGILIDTEGGVAFIGIGVNVHQLVWPPSIAGIGISLAQLGVESNRLDVARAIIRNTNDTFDWDDGQLSREFSARDVLLGTVRTFESGGRRITGRVIAIDPLRGLIIETEDGEHELAAAATSLAPEVDEAPHP